MLKVTIPEQELFDNEKEEFLYIPKTVLTLEHSLLSLSKWESKWKKPFLSNKNLPYDQMADYIRCMTVNTVHKDVYTAIPNQVVQQVQNYIDDSMTATWFKETGKKKSNEVVTAEIIYYWMVCLQIPFECEKWHLNRLLALIRVCSEKSDPKKMSKKESFSRQKALNQARRKAHHSRG